MMADRDGCTCYDETTRKCPVHVYCSWCGKHKAPVGRDVPAARADSYCHWDTCDGYYEGRRPPRHWPGEEG